LNAAFYSPRGLDFDDDGNVYVLDSANLEISKIAS
jgi:hypothetical protein